MKLAGIDNIIGGNIKMGVILRALLMTKIMRVHNELHTRVITFTPNKNRLELNEYLIAGLIANISNMARPCECA